MFKVVRDFVDKPMLICYCDRSCSANAVAFVDPGKEAERETQAEFLSGLRKSGWALSLAEHVCPEHVAQDKANKSGIVIPKGVLVK